MSFVLSADGCYDCSVRSAREQGVARIATNFIKDGVVYADACDEPVDSGELGRALAYAIIPTEPYRYRAHFERLIADGSEVVHLSVSSGLGGSYSNAAAAADSMGADGFGVRVFDTRSVSCGMRLIADAAIRLRDAGATAGECVAALERLRDSVSLIAMCGDPDALKRTGRMGEIPYAYTGRRRRPTVRLDADGVPICVGTVVPARLVRTFVARVKRDGYNIESGMLYIAYAGDDRYARALETKLGEQYPACTVCVSQMTPVACYGLGAGSIAIAFSGLGI